MSLNSDGYLFFQHNGSSRVNIPISLQHVSIGLILLSFWRNRGYDTFYFLTTGILRLAPNSGNVILHGLRAQDWGLSYAPFFSIYKGFFLDGNLPRDSICRF